MRYMASITGLLLLMLAAASSGLASKTFQGQILSACGAEIKCLVCHTAPKGGKHKLTVTGGEFKASGFDPYFFVLKR